MQNHIKFVRQALRMAEKNRQQALSEALLMRQQAEKELPQLQQLQNEKMLYGIQAAKLATLGAKREDIDAVLEKAKKADEKYQTLLAQSDFACACAPRFHCPHCQDRGKTEQGRLCSCVREIVRALRRREVSTYSPLALSSFKTFSLERYPSDYSSELGCTIQEHMTQLYEYTKHWATQFSRENPSLYLCGNAGLGKTHLALAMAQEVLDQGYDVIYASAQNIFETIEKERFGTKEGDTLQSLLACDLLILDDLGTEYISAYVSSCLYNIINTRVCHSLPTIYTSNIIQDKDLQRRYTEKIVSRLLGSCEMLYFCGEDLRLKEKHQAT